MKKIAVIMPCYLGEYPGAATNRQDKFIRAVNSFIGNDYPNKHLVIVSDGCEITTNLYYTRYKNNVNISLVKIDKEPLFSGMVREEGLSYARKEIKPDIQTYLDADDQLLSTHLQYIADNIGSNDWIYYPDQLMARKYEYWIRQPELISGKIGTSNISHISKPEFNWLDCDGYGHDFKFISQKLLANSNNFSKIDQESGYIVMHMPGQFDN
jgi:glycosyltransferase involved in cell wall biosynthesis